MGRREKKVLSIFSIKGGEILLHSPFNRRKILVTSLPLRKSKNCQRTAIREAIKIADDCYVTGE
jgi:hypothetical protein